MSDLQAIRSDADLEKALTRIEEIFFAEEGTPEEKELEDLASKVRVYESVQFPRRMPEPIEAIKFMMEQGAYLPEDLVCSAVRHSELLELLAGTRSLSFEMARAFGEQLGIPIEILWPHNEHTAEFPKEGTLPAVGTTPD